MIPKAERDADKAICEAATPPPWVRRGSLSLDSTVESEVCDARGVPRLCAELSEDVTRADADFIVTARNRLPLYIAALDEMERRIAAVKARALEYAASEERADRQHGAGMREALKILRGEK